MGYAPIVTHRDIHKGFKQHGYHSNYTSKYALKDTGYGFYHWISGHSNGVLTDRYSSLMGKRNTAHHRPSTHDKYTTVFHDDSRIRGYLASKALHTKGGKL